MRAILSSFSAIIILFLGVAFFAPEAYAFSGVDVMAQCSPIGVYVLGNNSCEAEEKVCINSNCSLDANGNQFKTHRVKCNYIPSSFSFYYQCGCPPAFTGNIPSHWSDDPTETEYVEKYPYECKHYYDIIENTNPVENFTEVASEKEVFNTFTCLEREPNGTILGRKCGECNNNCYSCIGSSCALGNSYLGYFDNGTYTCNNRVDSNCTSNCNNACQAPPPSATSPPGSTPTPTPSSPCPCTDAANYCSGTAYTQSCAGGTPTTCTGTKSCSCSCGRYGQQCCSTTDSSDPAYYSFSSGCNLGGSLCSQGTCSDSSSTGKNGRGRCKDPNENCKCGDGIGASCCGDEWRDSYGATSGCESIIPTYRSCIQGLVCDAPGYGIGDKCIRFKINGTVFVDDNGDGVQNGTEATYQGAKVDYWYGEPKDDPCGKRASSNWGQICLGKGCSTDGDCRTGQCYGSGGYICTTTSFSTTFSPDKTSYSQSSGFYEFTPNNSYTSSYQKHIIRLNVPSGYTASPPNSDIQTREISSGQYEDGPLPPVNFGIKPYNIGGHVKNKNTQTGIAGVQVRVVNSSGNYQTATTDSTGLFKVSGFIAPGAVYHVRVVGNINSPQTAPAGYLSPARTAYFRSGWPFAHIGWTYNTDTNLDTNIGDLSYEAQTAGTNDCAGLDGSYPDPGTGQIVSSGTSTFRCSFAYDPLPLPGAPDWDPPAQDCPGGSPQVTLTWTSSQYAASYQIWRYGNGNWMQIGTTTNLTFDDPTISPSGYSSPIPLGGTTYRYMIRAVNASGTADSNILDLTTNACTGTPWIQTQGGDVHSNTGIDLKLPQPTP